MNTFFETYSIYAAIGLSLVFVIQFLMSITGFSDAGDISADTDIDLTGDFDTHVGLTASDIVSFKGVMHFLLGSLWGLVLYRNADGHLTGGSYVGAVITGLFFVVALAYLYRFCMRLKDEGAKYDAQALVGKTASIYSVNGYNNGVAVVYDNGTRYELNYIIKNSVEEHSYLKVGDLMNVVDISTDKKYIYLESSQEHMSILRRRMVHDMQEHERFHKVHENEAEHAETHEIHADEEASNAEQPTPEQPEQAEVYIEKETGQTVVVEEHTHLVNSVHAEHVESPAGQYTVAVDRSEVEDKTTEHIVDLQPESAPETPGRWCEGLRGPGVVTPTDKAVEEFEKKHVVGETAEPGDADMLPDLREKFGLTEEPMEKYNRANGITEKKKRDSANGVKKLSKKATEKKPAETKAKTSTAKAPTKTPKASATPKPRSTTGRKKTTTKTTKKE